MRFPSPRWLVSGDEPRALTRGDRIFRWCLLAFFCGLGLVAAILSSVRQGLPIILAGLAAGTDRYGPPWLHRAATWSLVAVVLLKWMSS